MYLGAEGCCHLPTQLSVVGINSNSAASAFQTPRRDDRTYLPPGPAMSYAESLASPSLAPTPPKPDILRGWIKTIKDAILVLEATRVGIVPRVTRRFHELEKRSIIQSGAILVFTEEESGIKRWTDPYLWSASRMQGNFLVRFSSSHIRVWG